MSRERESWREVADRELKAAVAVATHQVVTMHHWYFRYIMPARILTAVMIYGGAGGD